MQQRLMRSKIGGRRRSKAKQRLARLHTKIASRRSTYLHQVSARLVRDNDLTAIEALNVKGLAAGMLARSAQDAAWGKLIQYLRYKAENAGCTLIEVNPKNTTQACSGCGVIVPKKLKDRWHDCPDCSLSLDRDHNAARNILHLAVAGGEQLNVTECRERDAGKINRWKAA